MTSSERAERVLEGMRSHRFRVTRESNLQADLERVLRATGLKYEREAVLEGCGRIDFMVGRVGIELKVQGGWRSVQSQLLRYAASDDIDVLILFTVKATHQLVKRELNGKPVHVYQLTNSAL